MCALKVGIAGGGVGGLAAAIALRKVGHEATVFEQASRYGRVGADIKLTPNAVKVCDGPGAGDADWVYGYDAWHVPLAAGSQDQATWKAA